MCHFVTSLHDVLQWPATQQFPAPVTDQMSMYTDCPMKDELRDIRGSHSGVSENSGILCHWLSSSQGFK